jgi:hypothetical protein
LSEQPPAKTTAADIERQKREAKKRLWKAGVLSWKFKERPWAKDMYDFARAHWGEQVHWLVHRRGTKSSTGIIIALEECLRAPGTACAIVCKTKEQAQEIIDESLLPLLEDCPANLQPRRIKNDFKYVFDHNGSKIVILPTDQANFRKGRGRKFKFILVTEAGFINKIDVVVASVLAPTTRDVLGQWQGTIVLESTPPEEADHAWISMYAAAELDGRAYFLPLSKNKWASPLFVKQCQNDCGGPDTVIYRREYECEFIRDDAGTVVPEFTADKAFTGDAAKSILPMVRAVERPAESDRYASMDIGGRDLTGILWGFYHFELDLVVIEDELTLLNMTSDDLAARVKAKEKELWGDLPDGKLTRLSDNSNVILLYDLQRLHQLRFWASAKDNKDAQINQLRIMVRDNRLAINPRCRLLIKTLRLARRAKQVAKGFEHGEEIGHADLLDALIYFIRNVKKRSMPKVASMRTAERDVRPPAPARSSSADALVRALRLRRR